MPRIIAMIPTYNEYENIGPLMDAILALGPALEVLVVDDDSPDGTWRLVARRAETDPRVHLLHRTTRRGRGLAGIAGFCEALRLGADWVIEMDADWSHDPKWIPALLSKAETTGADVVIGSRLVRGGGEVGRPASRQWITRAANTYIRLMLRLPVRDATSGYRLFSRRCLESLPWDAMRATGPEVVQEVLLAAHARGFKIAEAPILFVERRHGQSTFNRRIMVQSLKAMVRLRRHPGRLIPWEATDPTPPRKPAERRNLTPIPGPLLVPLSWLYGLARRTHRAWTVHGPGGRKRLEVPVVCVGNLTVGGTGKTPFTRFMAGELRRLGFRPAIVSRGYRARDELVKPLIVSDGEQVLATAERAGDEPRWLAENCPGVPVVIHPDRFQAGQAAVRLLDADLVLLDDGFQHDRLVRQLNLVLWDVNDRPERMRLLPAGRLREGLSALRRAQAVILTHAEYLPEAVRETRITRVIQRLKRAAPGVVIFEAETVITGYRQISGRLRPEMEPGEESAWPWSGRRVLAISGLARPEGFESMLRGSGAQLARHFIYSDHHAYGIDQVDQWREAMNALQAELILTTTKDAVKLAALPLFGLPILAVEIEMRVADELRWQVFLDQWTETVRRKMRKAEPRAQNQYQ